jgi:hypothetical protein
MSIPVKRFAEVYQAGVLAGYLIELDRDIWRFSYLAEYEGRGVSLTMPRL